MKKLTCLRCGSQMQFAFQEKFQMGEHTLLTGDWSHLRSGSLELEVWCCPDCGKVEFFTPETVGEYTHKDLPQKKCPQCGREHDFDYPKCPYCKHKY